MQYTYLVGQIVRAKSRLRDRPRVALYQVTRLLPSELDATPCYQVRSLQDGVEWVIAQDRLEPA